MSQPAAGRPATPDSPRARRDVDRTTVAFGVLALLGLLALALAPIARG